MPVDSGSMKELSSRRAIQDGSVSEGPLPESLCAARRRIVVAALHSRAGANKDGLYKVRSYQTCDRSTCFKSNCRTVTYRAELCSHWRCCKDRGPRNGLFAFVRGRICTDKRFQSVFIVQVLFTELLRKTYPPFAFP